MDKEAINLRFIEAVNYLINNRLVQSKAELASILGVKAPKFSEILNSRMNIGTDLAATLCSSFKINSLWLLTGNGNMLIDKEERVVAKEEKKRHLIPLYDLTAIGGRQYGADMLPASAPTEMIDTGDWFQDATAAMRVQGDSMSPEYKSGSIVALRQINDSRIIMYGEDYVIETDEIRVIKRLQRSDDPSYLMACSVNTEQWETGPMKGRLIHEPFEIPKDSIRRLFLVLGEVRRNHSCNIIDVVK